MEAGEQPPCPSPSPCKMSSSIFRDISNFKTPKRPSINPNFHSPCPKFFTASKETPRNSSSFRRRPSLAPSSYRSKASQRLKAFELEQSRLAHQVQIKKEQSLRSLAKSLTVWLNFLLERPGSCGCTLSIGNGNEMGVEVSAKGKRDSGPAIGVRVDTAWRSPKRQRDLSWKAVEAGDEENTAKFTNSMYSGLQSSLKDVCSFDDLKQRLELYLSLSNCKKVFDIMTQVAKNIDEGRLKMKTHCPLVTDVGLREKATKVLMGYNPVWLRIGMYIIFGGNSLLSDGDVGSDQETTFLRMIVEKLFFSHSGMAKAYAYNKKVEGLYRPGYYEALGNIILKRLLLLILILDRAKCQSKLSLKYGIDGVDGGSPLLFSAQSCIKSSQQVIHDLLSSDIMLGEGNVIAHLAIVGYKVSYQQNALVEYDFKVTYLFADLQDGVRLCRAVQLLLNDSSILMKMVVPSDTRKKNLANCDVAFQYLRQAGASLTDEDGATIMGEDVADGDKELIISLLWNMFVHLQLPLFIKKTMLIEEICKIRGVNMDFQKNSSLTSLEMLLSWIQAICRNYDCKADSFSSLVDGKAVWCLLDYYFRKELFCSYSSKNVCRLNGEESIVLPTDYSDAVHNFLLSQKLATLLGNFPEVLQISDILKHKGACNDRSVIILLVFLASQLIAKKNMDQLNFHKLLGCDCQSPQRKYYCAGRSVVSSEADQMKEVANCNSPEDAAERFKAIKAWWQDMAEKNYKAIPTMEYFSTAKGIDIQQENAAKVIQSHFRRVIERRHFLKMLKATCFLQIVIRAWLAVSRRSGCIYFPPVQARPYEREVSETWRRYVIFIDERHNFLKLKRSILIIQQAARTWITKRHQRKRRETSNVSAIVVVDAATVVQKYIRGCLARMKYANGLSQVANTMEVGANDCQINTEVEVQLSQKSSVICNSLHDQNLAATAIQTCFRCWLLRKRFQNQRQAVIKFQCYFRMSKCWQAYRQYKAAAMSATTIQSFVRRWLAQREACRHRHLIITIQRHWRSWLIRREFLSQRMAAIKIQSAFRGLRYRMEFYHQKHFALDIQRFVRGRITRNKLLGASSWSQYGITTNSCVFKISGGCFNCSALNVVVGSVLKLQRWWRGILFLKVRTKSAVIIQSHIRGWKARRRAARDTHGSIAVQVRTKYAVIIQSHIRGWIVRRRAARERHVIIVVQVRTKSAMIIQSHIRGWIARRRAVREKHGIVAVQVRAKSTIIIQSHIRGWIARRRAAREKHRIIVVQSFWKGYLARKESRQLQDLRMRMQKSAKNVDDGMRIINRLVAALSELLNMKSVSGILHTCATLDMATEHSQKCCETLVDVGAINTLLKLICSISRSIPDKQVLKHALSTLRNLARYPHLVEALIDSPKSIEIIFLEFLRNKEEGYFIASELLKKILSCCKGIESVRRSAALLKRLHGLVEELNRKVYNEKRNARAVCAKENYERRLKEASELLKMVMEV